MAVTDDWSLVERSFYAVCVGVSGAVVGVVGVAIVIGILVYVLVYRILSTHRIGFCGNRFFVAHDKG